MNFGEVYSALQQGVIDGEENPLAIIDSARLYEVQKYLSTTGHVFAVYLPVISKAFFDALPEDQQTLIRESMKTASDYQQEIINSEEAAQLQKIRDAGVEVTELSPEEKQAFVDQTASVREKYREQVGEDVYDRWVAAVSEASAN